MKRVIPLLIFLIILSASHALNISRISKCGNGKVYVKEFLYNIDRNIDYTIITEENITLNWNISTPNFIFEKYHTEFKGRPSNIYHWHIKGEKEVYLNYSFEKPSHESTIYIVWFNENGFEEKEYTFNPSDCTSLSTTSEEEFNKVYIAEASTNLKGGWWGMASFGTYIQQGINNLPIDFWIGLLAFVTYIALFGLVYQIEIHLQKKKEIKPAKKKTKSAKKVKVVRSKKTSKKKEKKTDYDKVLERLKKIEKELK